MRSFLMNNFCEKLGLFKSAVRNNNRKILSKSFLFLQCQASIEKDGTDLLQILTNEIVCLKINRNYFNYLIYCIEWKRIMSYVWIMSKKITITRGICA